jgi:hypothetical protein
MWDIIITTIVQIYVSGCHDQVHGCADYSKHCAAWRVCVGLHVHLPSRDLDDLVGGQQHRGQLAT